MKNPVFNAVIYFMIALLILIQQGDNELLINGWHGLAFACFTCVFMALLNIFIAIDQLNKIIDGAPPKGGR